MQDAAALVAQDQSTRRLVQVAPVRLVLVDVAAVNAPPERGELRILLRVVGGPVPEACAEEVVRNLSARPYGDGLRQGVQAVGRPRAAIRHAGDERPVLGG